MNYEHINELKSKKGKNPQQQKENLHAQGHRRIIYRTYRKAHHHYSSQTSALYG